MDLKTEFKYLLLLSIIIFALAVVVAVTGYTIISVFGKTLGAILTAAFVIIVTRLIAYGFMTLEMRQGQGLKPSIWLVETIVQNLTNEELDHFVYCLHEYLDQKNWCMGEPWYHKVEALFTLGERLDPATQDQVVTLARSRLGN